MPNGRILVSEKSGNYIIKLVGDVRVTLCASLKSYIDSIFQGRRITSVVIDLTEVKAMDSTTLGLLAKIAVHEKNQQGMTPMVITKDPSIVRLLESMGFDEIFTIRSELPTSSAELTEIPFVDTTEEQVRTEVIEAHKALMSLNLNNREAFKDLVCALEKQHA